MFQIPADWFDVDKVDPDPTDNDWYTHLGYCPECTHPSDKPK